jgi:Ca2+-binding EF-hand superfamily protein
MDYCSEVMFRCIFEEIFERFYRNRSGRIDSSGFCDALLSLGYPVSKCEWS